jgi:pilus biogenesis lipoprotein CpaD
MKTFSLRTPIALLGLLSMAACAPEADMQGHDPKDFYRAHPIKNKVERKTESFAVRFQPGSERLTSSDIAQLREQLRHVSPMAAEMITLQVHPSQQHDQARHEHLRKLLASIGFKTSGMAIEPTESVEKNQVRIDLDYAVVVSPRCPDWRTSSVTTYSNTQQAGWSCAYVNNMGLMVVDPRDLQRGSGEVSPDVRRNSEVLTGYHTNTGGSSSESDATPAQSGGETAQPNATGP